MIRIHSLITPLLLCITFIFSSLFAQAEDTTIPSWGTFGGATIADGGIFDFPSTGEVWGGFAALEGDTNYFPFVFTEAGQITFTASVPSGGTANVNFTFEYLPHPNTTPSYVTENITISGSTDTVYTVTIPSQGENTFSNFLLKIVEQDVPVKFLDVIVSDDDIDPNAPTPGAAGETTINQWAVFDGTTISEGGIFEFPSSAQTWAGFANDDNSVYPFSFNEAGQITFTASVPSGGTADVRFKFEKNPYPDTTPDHLTSTVTVSGSTDTEYTITIPSQGANTFSSFLFFIVTQDTPVKLGDVVISDDAGEVAVIENGVRFVFEEVSGGTAAYTHNTETVEITSTTAQSFSIDIPAYSDPAATFESMLLYVIGADQPITVSDITLTVGGVTYGGAGADSLLFDNAFGGVAVSEETYTYTFLSSSQSWGGFALNTAQVAEFPTLGLVFSAPATLTFTANLSDTAVDLPPIYDGETAFSNGVINTAEDTGTGRDTDPPYRWSAYISWFTTDESDAKGTFAGGDSWGELADLPATWSNGVITLAPNTASYDAWSEVGSDDGIYYLEQTLKIEGTRGTSAILGKTVNFSGTVDSYTLDPRYTVSAFIKYLDPNNNNVTVSIDQSVLSAAGDFALSLDIPTGDYTPQIGFVLEGRNANPATNWGNIQISNLVATYEETSTITEGNFTNGSNAYWGYTTGVEFNTDGGYGPIPGQVVMTNGGSNRAGVYLASNQEQSETIDKFGMTAGNTYDVSYYMNRISGNDLGLVQFAFYLSDTGTWVYLPDYAGTIHTDANPTNGTWVQYTQTIEVPASATHATLFIISGAESVIAFDQITVAQATAANTFENWLSDNGITGGDATFTADPDNDGIPNGLENFLGTLPNAASAGMSNVAKTANGVSMRHSKNSAVSDGISASYVWSKDLATWNPSGATVEGTTVTIATEDNSPSEGTTTATATVSGTDSDNVFIKVTVSSD